MRETKGNRPEKGEKKGVLLVKRKKKLNVEQAFRLGGECRTGESEAKGFPAVGGQKKNKKEWPFWQRGPEETRVVGDCTFVLKKQGGTPIL